jgi:subtilase family serine protease
MIACSLFLLLQANPALNALTSKSGELVGQAASRPVSTTAPRIVQQIDETKRLKLVGNVPLAARTQPDLGEASASTLLTHMRLVLSRSPEQEAALDSYLVQLQSKSSPNYHKWLTPEQFGELYGPADSDISSMVAWLESHGLKIESVAKGRTNIAFSGTVHQVEEAFHTQIHSFAGKDQQFYSNITDPSIPAALAPVVMGVAHLDTIVPKPDYVRGPLGMLDPEKKRLVPMVNGQEGRPRPDLTLQESSGYFLLMVPGDAATIYNTPNTKFNANYTSGTSYTGAGVKIGLGGAGAIQSSTVVDFRTVFLGDSTPPVIENEDNVGSNGATDEAYIDTELSGGIAPGAAIYYYASSDLTTAIDDAINGNEVDIFSLSFSNCELALTNAENAEFNGYWAQAAGQGIAVTVSTGDVGSALCDDVDASGTTQAQYGLSVNGFASTPYNIAVGGTDFAVLNDSFSTYVSTSQGSASTFYRSALKSIPETTWNDSTQTDGLYSENVPWTSASGNANDAAGSGGVSSCSTNTSTDFANGTCTSGYAKPYWQRGTGVPSDKVRDLPDVSLMSGNGFDSATWLACTDDAVSVSGLTGVTSNCTTASNGSFYFAGFGGTSTATPTFAGILALVQQKTGDRLGQAAKEIYDLYNGSHASTIFHDTTVGNISVPCVTGTPDCVENTAGYYYESGYNTTAGYDLATGLGSVDAAQLLTYWGTGTGPETATLSITPSETSFAPSVSITVAATVTGNSTAGTPTGTVTLSGGGYSSSAEALSSGAYTFTIPANSLSSGTDVLTVTYSGDSSYASTSVTTTVSVAAAVAKLSGTSLSFVGTTIGTATGTQSVTLSSTGTSSLTISGITVGGTNSSEFSESNNCGASVAVGADCAITVFFTPSAFGTAKATVSIADNASGSPQTISLSGSETEAGSYSLTAAAVSVAPGASGSSAITATGTGGYVGPNTITLSTCTLATSPAGASDLPTCTITGATVSLAAGSTSGTGGSVSIATTAASSNAVKLGHLNARNSSGVWLGAGGAALAGLLLLGVPARGRKWRTLLGVFFFAAALGLVSGCGGGGGGGGGGGNSNPGTTAGTYTFTVTGSDAGGTQETATVTVTVN